MYLNGFIMPGTCRVLGDLVPSPPLWILELLCSEECAVDGVMKLVFIFPGLNGMNYMNYCMNINYSLELMFVCGVCRSSRLTSLLWYRSFCVGVSVKDDVNRVTRFRFLFPLACSHPMMILTPLLVPVSSRVFQTVGSFALWSVMEISRSVYSVNGQRVQTFVLGDRQRFTLTLSQATPPSTMSVLVWPPLVSVFFPSLVPPVYPPH